MRILRLYLENWRNFTKVDVALQYRVFIAGPNAAGKSYLLDAVRFLQDIASVGGGLQNAVQRNRNGVSKIRCLAARRYSDLVLEMGFAREAPCSPHHNQSRILQLSPHLFALLVDGLW